MNDQPTESVEFTDKDAADLESLGITTGDEPSFHTILEVWQKVIEPARTEQHEKVTPQYASRIVSKYPEVHYGDMIVFKDLFYAKIIELLEILEDVIASDPKALSWTTAEEDREHNSKHYRKLLLEWQKHFLAWELEWETTDPFAAVKLAAIGEVHHFFFSETGISAHLQNIQFQYTEQDQAEVATELEAMRGTGE